MLSCHPVYSYQVEAAKTRPSTLRPEIDNTAKRQLEHAEPGLTHRCPTANKTEPLRCLDKISLNFYLGYRQSQDSKLKK